MEENKENELSIVVKESGLETTQATNILKKFNTFFEQAKEWEEKARNLVVKDETETEKMAEAREARLCLKKIRTDAESVRKEMKEEYIRTGKAIDGVANVIKALIVPIEEHLEKQEKFIENAIKDKVEKTKADRIDEMSKYVEDVLVYNLDGMSDEVFANLLAQVKSLWEKRQFEIKKMEDDKIANEKKHVLWEKRQFELAPYKFFFGATEKVLTIDSSEEEFQSLLAFFIETKKEFDADQEAIAIENAKLKADAKKKEEQDAKDKAIADAKLKEVEDAKKKLEDEIRQKKEFDEMNKRNAEEKERQAQLAPEKDKLTDYAERIQMIKAPQDLSKAGLEIVKLVETKLLIISQEIKLKIKEL